MESYLYLLPLKSGKVFKIGISSKNLNRINQHNSTYGIDLENSYIIQAQSKVIRFLEIELLCLFPPCSIEELLYKDGYTEIREIVYLKEALKYILDKPKILNIEISSLKTFIVNNKHSKPKKNKIEVFNPKYFYDKGEIFFITLSKLFKEDYNITYMRYENGDFYLKMNIKSCSLKKDFLKKELWNLLSLEYNTTRIGISSISGHNISKDVEIRFYFHLDIKKYFNIKHIVYVDFIKKISFYFSFPIFEIYSNIPITENNKNSYSY